MKLFGLLFFCLLAFHAKTQLLSGDLLEKNRKLITASNFTLKDPNKGEVICELSVNRAGEVTSIIVGLASTTAVSIPSKIRVRNYLKSFKFEKGNQYPAFHHVKVKITLIN
jgi:hypothetical protein